MLVNCETIIKLIKSVKLEGIIKLPFTIVGNESGTSDYRNLCFCVIDDKN